MPKLQVGAAANGESRILLKTIGSRPSRAGMPADLAHGFANNSRGRQQMQLDSRDERDPYEPAVRQQRTGLDDRDLATDQ